MNITIVNNITKEYPDMIKVVVYKTPLVYAQEEGITKRNKLDVDSNYIPEVSSISRTKTLIKDIVLCNDFDLFVTFTFDPSKVNRYNYTQCAFKISRWIHHQRERSPELKYLIVPEQHKDGAWHFHALISHYNGSMRDSKHQTSTGRQVYNITSYRGGFTTAVKIDNREAVAHYVTKYITKDFIKMFNRKRFFASKGLNRPKKTVNSTVLLQTPPIFKKKTFETSYTEEYQLPKF